MMRRALKLGRILSVGDYRRALLRHRSAATTEHERVPLGGPFSTVLDVGAHFGEFALVASRRFPGARIVCVEPLPAAQATLRAVVPHVEVLPFAAAAVAGPRAFHVSRASAASSLLPLTAALTSAFPGTEAAAEVEVDARPLDELLDASALDRPVLLKIDVQGGELDVLRGAERVLEVVDAALVECSFVELYQGQALAPEVIDFLRVRGLGLAGVHSVLHDRSGRTLQADLHFSR
jgi:FkbM family methyltransferase